MLYRGICLLLAATAAFAADDAWSKVKELKSGTELRVFKKGSIQPILAKSDDVTEENLLIIVKNEETAIPKDQVDRVDYRPSKARVTTETKTKTTDPDTTPGPPGHGSLTPGSSTSTSVGIGSKPDFETIYRRPSPPPAAKK